MSEIKTYGRSTKAEMGVKMMRTMSFNLYRAMLFGYKPTAIQRLIYLRSDHVHMELQFSSRYGGISFSSTLMDGVDGCRFKMIEYSHPDYWDEAYIPVTWEQENKMFIKACEMAGTGILKEYAERGQQHIEDARTACHPNLTSGRPYYGPNHVKYDKMGAGISYITQWKLWKPHKKKMVCNRACCEVILVGKPDAMGINSDPEWPLITADYASMTPSQAHGMLMNYTRR